MFEVGKKVVCIDDSPHDDGEVMFGLKKNEIYPTVAINQCKCGQVSIGVGLLCTEAVLFYCNKCKKDIGIARPGSVALYSADRFRPVDYTFADQALEKVFEQELITQ